MYIREEMNPSGISLGLGWLGRFAAASDAAEARRLKDEMMKPTATADKIERTYRKWLDVRSEEDWEVYRLAAYAAGQLGCSTLRYLRFMKALGAKPPQAEAQQLTSEKQEMELNWTHVDIRLRRNAKGDLQVDMPFGIPERRAIERAQKELKKNGKFQGLLPAIAYTIDDHAVPLGPDHTISRGVSVVNIDQRGDGSIQLQSKPGPFKYLQARDECQL